MSQESKMAALGPDQKSERSAVYLARRWSECPSWKDSLCNLEQIWNFKERHVILGKKFKLRILVFTVLMGS